MQHISSSLLDKLKKPNSKLFTNVYYIKILFFVTCLTFTCCKDYISNPGPDVSELCYQKPINHHWNIFTNTISGDNPNNISNYEKADEYPRWSPNGRYILFKRHVDVYGPLVYIYDVKTKTLTNLTTDGGLSGDFIPRWTPNNHVLIYYQKPLGSSPALYFINPDGTEKIKILDIVPTEIFFYKDDFNFLYTIDYTKVYKSNIAATENNLLIDSKQALNADVGFPLFNSNTEELLFTMLQSDGIDAICTYNLKTKKVNVVHKVESGYRIGQMQYSPDFSIIAFQEFKLHPDNINGYISILKDSEKIRLVELTKGQNLDFNPIQISYDNRYLAYSINIFQNQEWISWTSDLYIVEVNTGDIKFIDNGIFPSWKP